MGFEGVPSQTILEKDLMDYELDELVEELEEKVERGEITGLRASLEVFGWKMLKEEGWF